MKTLTDSEKIEYIANNFHQYYNITLNQDLKTTETINLVMPTSLLEQNQQPYTHNYQIDENLNIFTLLSKYEDTNISKTAECSNPYVVDGDTFYANVTTTKDGITEQKREKIRLLGVDTPEMNYYSDDAPENGAEESKAFLEKILYQNTTFDIHIDEVKPRDAYDRILAVLIVKNKNINEVLLKEGFAQIMYIPPCEFNAADWATRTTKHADYLFQYLNSSLTNVVFTPKNDINKIYPYEIYRDVFYIKLNPYSKEICMHVLPKIYDCSNKGVLLLKDDMIERRKITKSDNYKIYNNRSNINAYYQYDNRDRERESDIPDSKKQPGTFNPNDFPKTNSEGTFCDFEYDIEDLFKNKSKLMICAGYRYNRTSPYYAIHYMGVRDYHEKQPQNRCYLIDANWDNILRNDWKTNHITKTIYQDTNPAIFTDDKILCPDHTNISTSSLLGYGIVDHTDYPTGSYVSLLYHKKIKYIGTELYAEEQNQYGFKTG